MVKEGDLVSIILKDDEACEAVFKHTFRHYHKRDELRAAGVAVPLELRGRVYSKSRGYVDLAVSLFDAIGQYPDEVGGDRGIYNIALPGADVIAKGGAKVIEVGELTPMEQVRYIMTSSTDYSSGRRTLFQRYDRDGRNRQAGEGVGWRFFDEGIGSQSYNSQGQGVYLFVGQSFTDEPDLAVLVERQYVSPEYGDEDRSLKWADTFTVSVVKRDQLGGNAAWGRGYDRELHAFTQVYDTGAEAARKGLLLAAGLAGVIDVGEDPAYKAGVKMVADKVYELGTELNKGFLKLTGRGFAA